MCVCVCVMATNLLELASTLKHLGAQRLPGKKLILCPGVACHKQQRGELKVCPFCSAPQHNGKYMHVTRDKNCFHECPSREYNNP